MADIDITASLSGEAAFGLSNLEGILVLTALLDSSSSLNPSIYWRSHPSSPTANPSVNSAATLEQFINALGPSRASLKAVTSHRSTVDANPVKKAVAPR